MSDAQLSCQPECSRRTPAPRQAPLFERVADRRAKAAETVVTARFPCRRPGPNHYVRFEARRLGCAISMSRGRSSPAARRLRVGSFLVNGLGWLGSVLFRDHSRSRTESRWTVGGARTGSGRDVAEPGVGHPLTSPASNAAHDVPSSQRSYGIRWRQEL